jgi:hypothetical protein
MALTWTDWRGHDYTVGDTILYARMSGQSCEMAEGIIEDLGIYYKDGRYRWARLKDGEELPTRQVWVSICPETGREYQSTRRGWEQKQVTVPVENERRAKIMPTMRTSRFNSYEWGTRKWNNTTCEYEPTERKPITLRVVASITAIVP